MEAAMDTMGLLENLEQSAQARDRVSQVFGNLVKTLTQAETVSPETSGQLGLSQQIKQIKQVEAALSQGTFRLLVLGDMKRGKSTFLNALLGDRLLPSDVNPCTAILTILRYGDSQQVTIHFKGDKPPETIDFQTFKENYTIDPDEAKKLDEQQELAFPDVSHAVVESTLPLLKQGVEFVDTPGLNDTEARNQQVLNYISDCQAILFVLNANQPCTLDERRYLNNYLKDRGLALFFLVNGWDRVRNSLVDPDDEDELQAAATKLRQVFRQNLAEYCQVDGEDRYDQRVFEISALEVLRRRIKDANADLSETGFPEFMASLGQFLVQERGQSERQWAETVARQTYHQVSEAVDRRIPLLDETTETLSQKIDSVQSEFAKLKEIRDAYQRLIRTTSAKQSKATADSFKEYILNLEKTFESDFVASQPNLDFLEFLEKDKRAAFYTNFKRAFERYMNDRLAAWEFIAKQDLRKAFADLQTSAEEYQEAYAAVIERMNEKLLGQRFYAVGHRYNPDDISLWSDNIKDLFESIPDVLNDSASRFNYFWQGVLRLALVYVCVYVALYILGILFSSLVLNVVGVLLVSGGVLAGQAEVVRQKFLSTTKEEFVKHLPKIADEQWRPVYEAVQSCFDVYQENVISRISADIESRQGELENLLQQKKKHQINRDREIDRLTTLKQSIADDVETIAAL
ncbi:MAG: dynamin family protein [Leptolyngbyaceae cyanobacterium MO_188.B28]|nr:dynamin family protein [Leptolyngbyaceae cyanobacterium MO_188.B28]